MLLVLRSLAQVDDSSLGLTLEAGLIGRSLPKRIQRRRNVGREGILLLKFLLLPLLGVAHVFLRRQTGSFALERPSVCNALERCGRFAIFPQRSVNIARLLRRLSARAECLTFLG